MARPIFMFFFLSILHFAGISQSVEIQGALIISESNEIPIEGTMRWTGSDFEGWTGTKWLSFTIGSKVADGSGNLYSLVKIGSQIWLDHNLHTIKYNDGSSIPLATNVMEWQAATQATAKTPIMCWYNDKQNENEFPYGALYTYYAIDSMLNGNRSVCPIGFHVPDSTELNTLKLTLNVLGKAGSHLKVADTTYWNVPNMGADNFSGFSAYPAGRRGPSGTFAGKGEHNYLRSSTTASNPNAYYGILSFDSDQFNVSKWNRGIGMSVRCLQD